MMGILLRVNLRVNVNNGSIRGFQTKAPLVLQGFTKIESLTLSLKEAIVVNLPWRGLPLPRAVRSMMISALTARVCVMVVKN